MVRIGASIVVGADESSMHGEDLDVMVPATQSGVRATLVGGVPIDCAEWYRRVDNNGWRPVSEALLKGMSRAEANDVDDGDHDVIGVNGKGEPYHYSKMVRQKDARRRRKRQTRKWLRDLYLGGAVANNIVPYHEGDAPEEDPLFEEEAEKLLKWSVSLDFASYQASWAALATSAGSDARVPAGHMRHAPAVTEAMRGRMLDDGYGGYGRRRVAVPRDCSGWPNGLEERHRVRRQRRLRPSTTHGGDEYGRSLSIHMAVRQRTRQSMRCSSGRRRAQ